MTNLPSGRSFQPAAARPSARPLKPRLRRIPRRHQIDGIICGENGKGMATRHPFFMFMSEPKWLLENASDGSHNSVLLHRQGYADDAGGRGNNFQFAVVTLNNFLRDSQAKAKADIP